MPPPSTAKRRSLDEVDGDVSTDLRPSITVITGLPGAGKTSLAASLFSPKVTEHLGLSSEALKTTAEVRLPGSLWIAADEDGIKALQGKKLRPRWTLDLASLKRDANGNMSLALRNLHAYIEEAKGAGCTGFVVDTATAFGALLVAEFVDGSENTFAGWQTVGNEQLKLLNLGKELGLRQVWLCQPVQNKLEEQALAEETNKKGSQEKADLLSAKAAAQGLAGGTSLILPALSGKMFPPVLNAQCSISGWLRKIALNGGKSKREWLPYGGDGCQGKARYEGILKDREEPDLWQQDLKILELSAQG